MNRNKLLKNLKDIFLSGIIIGYSLRSGLYKETNIFTHLTTAEKVMLNRIAKQLPDNSIAVEIGSYLGASSCFIANGIKKTNGKLFCIDTWENQTMPEGERNTYDEFINNTSKYSDVIVTVKGKSTDVVNHIAGKTEKIDLLFIDGDHSYTACNNDWKNYSPMLHKDSIVVFHDTGWAEGVRQVIAESVIGLADKIEELPNMQAYKIRNEIH